MGRYRLSRTDVGWLTGQGVLFVLAFVVIPSADGGWLRWHAAWLRPTGTVLMVVGLVIGLWAAAVLGRNLVPQPTPIDDGQIVAHGPYRLVRHPIYLGVLLLVIGALVRVASMTGLVVALGAVAFFDAKSRHEEAMLRLAHPEDHASLVARTRWRVVPGWR